jgi:hypothetical protein
MNTRFSIELVPHGHPVITYGLDTEVNTIELQKPMSLYFDVELDQGPHKFYIDFKNKTNKTPEMAVEIAGVTVEGIIVDRFKWAGIYTPTYPEPWASTQSNLAATLRSATYLGWNGRWELPFSVPIFTWIHQTENLGWIYS